MIHKSSVQYFQLSIIHFKLIYFVIKLLMLFYNIGAILKILSGIGILMILYNYVNVFEDVIIGLGFGFIAVFLLSWGISFYCFYIFQKFSSSKNNIEIASKSYKLSLLFGLFILVNLSLVILEKWNKFLGILIFVIFIILQLITASENEQ